MTAFEYFAVLALFVGVLLLIVWARSDTRCRYEEEDQ